MALPTGPEFDQIFDPHQLSEQLREDQLRVYEDFSNAFITEAPRRTRRLHGLDAIVMYDHLDFCGTIHYDGRPDASLLAVIRESSRRVKLNRERTGGYERADWWNEVDPDAYLVATTDGESITEWVATKADWQLTPDARLAKHKPHAPKFDQLTLDLKAVDGRLRAQMWLSREGGTVRIGRARQSGWLIGVGNFVHGPQFLDDPTRALEL